MSYNVLRRNVLKSNQRKVLWHSSYVGLYIVQRNTYYSFPNKNNHTTPNNCRNNIQENVSWLWLTDSRANRNIKTFKNWCTADIENYLMLLKKLLNRKKWWKKCIHSARSCNHIVKTVITIPIYVIVSFDENEFYLLIVLQISEKQSILKLLKLRGCSFNFRINTHAKN